MANKYDNNYMDKDIIKNLIDNRNPEFFLMPLYVNLFGKKYAILDICNITQSVPKSAFRVGFGASHSIIGNKNFPTGEMYKYNCEESFKYTVEETGIETHYFIIEESLMNEDESNPIVSEINMWIDKLYSRVEEYVKAYKETLKNEEEYVWEEPEDDIDDEEVGDDYFE